MNREKQIELYLKDQFKYMVNDYNEIVIQEEVYQRFYIKFNDLIEYIKDYELEDLTSDELYNILYDLRYEETTELRIVDINDTIHISHDLSFLEYMKSPEYKSYVRRIRKDKMDRIKNMF